MADEREFVKESIYHIRVKGNLDEKWGDWFEGLVMTSVGTVVFEDERNQSPSRC